MVRQYAYLGNGPEATGGLSGWTMSTAFAARCTRCDYYMVLDPGRHDTCSCGAMYKDADAGRFGSTLGDDQIEVYHLKP